MANTIAQNIAQIDARIAELTLQLNPDTSTPDANFALGTLLAQLTEAREKLRKALPRGRTVRRTVELP